MKRKASLFSYSILWIGVLLSRSPGANAEIPASVPFNPELKSQSGNLVQTDRLTHLQDGHYPSARARDRAANLSHWTPNIAPAELILPQLILPQLIVPQQRAIPDDRFIHPQQSHLTAIGELSELQEQQSQQIEQAIGQTQDPLPDTAPSPAASPDQVNDSAIDPVIDPATDPAMDPELGRLRLRERQPPEQTPEQIPEQSPEQTPEQTPEQRSAQSVFLLGRIDYFRSDNILVDDIDPVDDQLITAGVTLLGVPRIGPRTQLVASVGGNLARYSNLSELNYSDIQLRLGIRQNLFPRTYGELSWTHQQFFSAADGDQFLSDHSIRLSLWRRDELAPRLNLDSFYQFRLSFADPDDRSRFSNTVGAYLSYEIQRNLEVGLDYQFILTDFTQQDREDSYHQITAQLSYDLSRNSRISLYGGFSFGRSSESSVDFNSSILGISLSTSLAIF